MRLDEPGPCAVGWLVTLARPSGSRRQTSVAVTSGSRGTKPALNAAVQRVVVHRLPVRAVRRLGELVALGHKAAMAAEAIAAAVTQIAVGRERMPAGLQRGQLVGLAAECGAEVVQVQHGVAVLAQGSGQSGGRCPGRFETSGVFICFGSERVREELIPW